MDKWHDLGMRPFFKIARLIATLFARRFDLQNGDRRGLKRRHSARGRFHPEHVGRRPLINCSGLLSVDSFRPAHLQVQAETRSTLRPITFRLWPLCRTVGFDVDIAYDLWRILMGLLVSPVQQ